MKIEPYILLALLSAILMGLYSVSIKLFVRYRICSPALITIGYCIAAGVLSAFFVYAKGYHFPPAAITFFIVVAITTLCGHLLLALAMQEGDASTVVPLLGLKIPFSAILAFLFLGESYPASVYFAVVIAAVAVILFGLGKPAKAQGGHDKNPAVGVSLAIASALTYSIGDIFTKKSLVFIEPLQLILWVNIIIAIPCTGLLYLPAFKKYTIKPIDIAGFVLCAALVTTGIALYFASIKTSGKITTPNIILATRGFIVLLAGFILNKMLRIPIERQSNNIYILRLVATCMLFAGIAIILLQK
jgi:drug/metabolite transporter (DMT)-like permease